MQLKTQILKPLRAVEDINEDSWEESDLHGDLWCEWLVTWYALYLGDRRASYTPVGLLKGD